MGLLPVSVSVPKVHGVLQVAVRFPYVHILRALVPSPEPWLGSHEFLETVNPGLSGVLCPRSAGTHTVSSHRCTCRDPVTPALQGSPGML